MKLYDYFRSTASYRVRIALKLKNISYSSVPVNLRTGMQQESDYLSVNPQGLVPTLDENGHLIHQSLAIIEYLEDICPDPTLLPSSPFLKAQARSMAMTIACDIHPLNNLRVLKRLESQFHADEAQIQSWYHHWLKAGFDALTQHIESLGQNRGFCIGSTPGIADVCLVPQIYNAQRFKFDMKAYPTLMKIHQHCMGLDAFSTTSPDELMPKDIIA